MRIKSLTIIIASVFLWSCSSKLALTKKASDERSAAPTQETDTGDGQFASKLNNDDCLDPDLNAVLKGQSLMICDGTLVHGLYAPDFPDPSNVSSKDTVNSLKGTFETAAACGEGEALCWVAEGQQSISNTELDTLKADALPPYVVDFSPSNRAQSIIRGSGFKVTFNEDIEPTSVTSVTAWLETSAKSFKVTGTLSTSDNVVSFVPDSNLNANVSYRFVVRGIKDLAGNTLASPVISEFETGDYFANPMLFYNNSFFDGDDPAPNKLDDQALAHDLVAQLPSSTTVSANYSNYTKGINGLFIDIAGVSPSTNASDFEFKTGNDDTPGSWSVASAPSSVTIRESDGVGGTDRITIIWPDGAIYGVWLEITVKATANTGLATPEVYYFGNAPGDAYDNPNSARVGGGDFLSVQAGLVGETFIGSVVDSNRDGQASGPDLTFTSGNMTSAADELKFITVP